MRLRILPVLLLACFGTAAMAKLPPPDDATKAKAAETTAKAGWQAKVDAFQLCKAQDKVAARFRKAGGDAKPVSTAAAAPAKPANGPAASPDAKGTPVAAAALPANPCSDPGPFAYNPPEQKPLEAAGAHSPAGTAASPPSVRPESATMAPATKP